MLLTIVLHPKYSHIKASFTHNTNTPDLHLCLKLCHVYYPGAEQTFYSAASGLQVRQHVCSVPGFDPIPVRSIFVVCLDWTYLKSIYGQFSSQLLIFLCIANVENV